MTMKVAGRVVLFLLGTIASTTQAQPYGSWRGDTFWGRQLSCDEGQALVAACGSGQDKDCRLWGGQELTHKIRCVGKPTQDLMWHNQGSTKQTIKKDWGEWAFCAPNQVAVARCSGGGSRDCDGVSHTLTCVDVSSTARIRLDSLDTKRVCVDHGVDASCPVGYVVTGSCGSGKNGDCDTDLCSGLGNQDVYTGLKCTRAYAYSFDSVGNYTVARSPEFTFTELCKAKTVELEGEQSSREIKETKTFKTSTSLEVTTESTVSRGSSLTTSLSVTNEISAQVGLPKIGLGVSSKGSIETGLERTTTFDRSNTYREQLTTNQEQSSTVEWNYVLAGGYTWLVASWNARVTTYGSYELLYRQYTPGITWHTIVQESDIVLSAGALDERSFTLVLNSQNHDKGFLRTSSCTEIATQYMLGIGEFSNLTPNTQYDTIDESITTRTKTTNTDTTTNNSSDGEEEVGQDDTNDEEFFDDESSGTSPSSNGSILFFPFTILTIGGIVLVVFEISG